MKLYWSSENGFKIVKKSKAIGKLHNELYLEHSTASFRAKTKTLYLSWPLSRISPSHVVQKHWPIIPGCSQHDGWGCPSAPWIASAAVSEKENVAPCPFFALLSHGNECSVHRQTHTDTQTVQWEQVKAAVHKGEGWPARTCSAKLMAPIHPWERLLMRKPGAPAKMGFFLSFSRQDAQSY